MYSGEATVTNDQLEGVLKAGDILRVRGLWRSNSSSSSSSSSSGLNKKDTIQSSNNQKIDRDKRTSSDNHHHHHNQSSTSLTGGVPKIKLIQPTDKTATDLPTQTAPPLQTNNSTISSSNCHQTIQSNVEKKNNDKRIDQQQDDDKIDEVDEKIPLIEDPKSVLEQNSNSKQNKENVEVNTKKQLRKSSTTTNDGESIKSKSESGENVCKKKHSK